MIESKNIGISLLDEIKSNTETIIYINNFYLFFKSFLLLLLLNFCGGNLSMIFDS